MEVIKGAERREMVSRDVLAGLSLMVSVQEVSKNPVVKLW
jgi:hypothetical protein